MYVWLQLRKNNGELTVFGNRSVGKSIAKFLSHYIVVAIGGFLDYFHVGEINADFLLSGILDISVNRFGRCSINSLWCCILLFRFNEEWCIISIISELYFVLSEFSLELILFLFFLSV